MCLPEVPSIELHCDKTNSHGVPVPFHTTCDNCTLSNRDFSTKTEDEKTIKTSQGCEQNCDCYTCTFQILKIDTIYITVCITEMKVSN